MDISIYIKKDLSNLMELREKYKWKEDFFDFKGDKNFPSVEEIRVNQKEQFRDPFLKVKNSF